MTARARTPDLVFRGDPGPACAALARFVRPGGTDRLFEFHSTDPDPAKQTQTVTTSP